jgi:hypothetical protein
MQQVFRDLLFQTIEAVVAQHQEEGAFHRPYYLGWNGRHDNPRSHCQTNTGYAIYTNNLVRGLGLNINEETNALVAVGDPYGVQDIFDDMRADVEQTYLGFAGQWVVLNRVGLASEFQEDATGALVVKARGVTAYA